MYDAIKLWIKISLYCYFGKIKVHGLKNVPKNKPVLFLPNHQNALLDPLLIAVDCNRKPFFLTRSDVFKGAFLKKFFEAIRLIPVYRIRDGRASLQQNEAIFNRCAAELNKSEAVLMFPEANHNLERRIRPLSKGFTRILFKALAKNPGLDIQIVPVGLNYKNAAAFPDQAAVFFGKPIAVQQFVTKELDEKQTTDALKKAVSDALKTLTTHIPVSEYQETISALNQLGADFLLPKSVNSLVKEKVSQVGFVKPKRNFNKLILMPLLYLFNWPLILAWKLLIKPKVPEVEFMSTFRFAFALLAVPLFFILLCLGITYFSWFTMGVLFSAVVFGINVLLVRLMS